MASSDLEPLIFTDTKDTEGHYHELVNGNPNYPIVIKSVLWLSVENYVQSQKFQGTPLATKIQKTYDTEQAKELERNSAVLDFVRHDWHKVSTIWNYKYIVSTWFCSIIHRLTKFL